MDFTICEKVIFRAKDGNKYTSDLLMPFTSSLNSNKVIINELIIERYRIHKSEMINTWLNLMTNMGYFKNIENIEQNIFIATCLQSNDKQLIVSEKEDYPNIDYQGLTVYDCDEAIELLRPNNTYIYQNGSENQISTGSNSSNIK